MDARKHDFSVSLPIGPIWVEADPARLEQIVVNLLNNAAKYTDVGGLVRMSVQQEGSEAVIRVRGQRRRDRRGNAPPCFRSIHAGRRYARPILWRAGNWAGFGAHFGGDARRKSASAERRTWQRERVHRQTAGRVSRFRATSEHCPKDPTNIPTIPCESSWWKMMSIPATA